MSLQLDEIDQKIIETLRGDGRLSNREVARRHGLSEGTVRSRIRRIKQEHALRFIAVRRFPSAADAALVFVGINVERSQIRAVAEALQNVPEVHFAAIVLGRFEIIATLVLEDRHHLYRVLTSIGEHPGVLRTESMEALLSVKTFSSEAALK